MHSTKTKFVESETFSLHFDQEHPTFQIVSVVLSFLSFVWFVAAIVLKNGKQRFKEF